MLKTCLAIAGLLVAPLMVWLLVPALVCFVAFCVLSLPFIPLFVMTRQAAQPEGTSGKRGLPARAGLHTERSLA
jgi:hypothetical protein